MSISSIIVLTGCFLGMIICFQRIVASIRKDIAQNNEKMIPVNNNDLPPNNPEKEHKTNQSISQHGQINLPDHFPDDFTGRQQEDDGDDNAV